MHANLAPALALIFTYEGGFARRNTEPGGSVNMGISEQTLETWRRVHGGPVPTVDDVRSLTQAEATAIYQAEYADAVHFDDLPAGLDFCVLDSSVNEGVGAALRFLAEAIGFKYTGVRPPVAPLVKAAEAVAAGPIIDRICDARLAAKEQRADWSRFGKGWAARIESVRTHAKELAGAAA